MANIEYTNFLDFAMIYINGKWTSLIIYKIGKEKCGFNKLDRRIEKISRKILYEQLEKLIDHGLVIKTTKGAKQPFTVTYFLTDIGILLYDILLDLKQWGEKIYLEQKLNETVKIKYK